MSHEAIGWSILATLALALLCVGSWEKLPIRKNKSPQPPLEATHVSYSCDAPPPRTWSAGPLRRRPFVLHEGDLLICDWNMGTLELKHTNGQIDDLNAYCVELIEGSSVLATKDFGRIRFLHFASILAASYGLVVDDVSFSGTVLVAVVQAEKPAHHRHTPKGVSL